MTYTKKHHYGIIIQYKVYIYIKGCPISTIQPYIRNTLKKQKTIDVYHDSTSPQPLKIHF